MAVFYLRANRNVTADEITFLGDGGLKLWEKEKKLTMIELPAQWAEFSGFIPHLDWERVRAERKEVELTGDIISFSHGKFAGRDASAYTVTGILEGWV